MTVVRKYLVKSVVPCYRRNKPSRKKSKEKSCLSIRIYHNYLNNKHDNLSVHNFLLLEKLLFSDIMSLDYSPILMGSSDMPGNSGDPNYRIH